MKKELPNYRIVSENGETLLISHKHFHNLLQTLDALASRSCSHQQRKAYRRK